MSKQAVAYIRVSTDDQHLGPDAQREAIRAHCERSGLHLVAEHLDHGVSGGAPLDKRPALMAALDDLTPGAVLVVAKRDRLARDTMAAAMLERLAARAGASIETANGAGNGDSPEALLMRRMMDAFAEYERALIRARTKAALRVKRARGEKTGGDCPIGSTVADDGKHLVAEPREARALALIRELRAGGMTIRAIAAELNKRGVAARGRSWHPTTVARTLKRAAG